MLVLACVSVFATDANAQRRSSQNYPARSNMRLEIHNRMGSITIETWDRQTIQIITDRDNPPAQFTPQISGDTLMIDLRGTQNSGAGAVNFQIRVPVNSRIDVQTMSGDITVRGVQSESVSAEVTTEGDVQLMGIRASTVMAKNVMGLIVFEGELMSGGNYRFMSTMGQMHLRIPSNSGFNLTALTRSLNLGDFAHHFSAPGRRVTGSVGNGGATLSITNTGGSVSFMR